VYGFNEWKKKKQNSLHNKRLEYRESLLVLTRKLLLVNILIPIAIYVRSRLILGFEELNQNLSEISVWVCFGSSRTFDWVLSSYIFGIGSKRIIPDKLTGTRIYLKPN
jgi:hypothetical protein